MSGPALTHRVPPTALVGVGALSVQLGAALATKLFSRVGPSGAVTLRLTIAAVVLVGASSLVRRHNSAPSGWPRGRRDVAVIVAFGVVLGAMNLAFYEAIARIPLGVAVTLEFWGPLAVALTGSRTWLHALWAALAGAGVALLAAGTGSGLDVTGVAMALLAGLFWIGYILLGRETGRRFDTLTGLGAAMSVAAVLVLPVGLVSAGTGLVRPEVLALGCVVALLSSAIPYSLELVALKRVSPRSFGVLLSLDPGVAALAGLVVLGQHLDAREWLALSLVVGANIGNSLASPRGVVATTP